MLRHSGSYEKIGDAFDKLWKWVEYNRVPAQRTIGIYWDNPDHTPTRLLRSAACVEVPQGYLVGDFGGLPLEIAEIVGGNYATARYVGPYDEMHKAWTEMTDIVENRLRKTIKEDPAFEVYVNDAEDTPPAQLITELYMPVV